MSSKILLIVLCLVGNYCYSQTQLEMNQKAHNNYVKADKELNTVYQKILKEYSDDTLFITNLKAAQKIWIQLRDAEMKAKFPHEGEPGYYGSVFPCAGTCISGNLQKKEQKV